MLDSLRKAWRSKPQFPKIGGGGLLLRRILPWLLIGGTLQALNAQVAPIPGVGAQQERHPTPKHPSYTPSLIPEYLRERIDPSLPLFVSPDGRGGNRAAIERYLQTRERKERARDKIESRDFSDGADTEQDRRNFERPILRQFGVDRLYYQPGESSYRESATRRFQIVFLLSLPIALACSYGLGIASKGSFSKAPVFTGPETAAMVAVGLALSGSIAWYDLGRWEQESGPAAGAAGRSEPQALAQLSSYRDPGVFAIEFRFSF